MKRNRVSKPPSWNETWAEFTTHLSYVPIVPVPAPWEYAPAPQHLEAPHMSYTNPLTNEPVWDEVGKIWQIKLRNGKSVAVLVKPEPTPTAKPLLDNPYF